MANPFQPDRVDDATIRRNFDRLQTLLARYEKAVGGFRAYRGTAQSPTTGTVIGFNTEVFDYSGWFDIATNVGRFTPKIAGLYQFSWNVSSNAALTTDRYWMSKLYKNGAANADGVLASERTNGVNSPGSALVEANGTTDYFEVVITHSQGAGTAVLATAVGTFFSGHYVGGKP
jgi:hypothetical protein